MKRQKKVKLNVGDIWQVPKTLEVRTIYYMNNFEVYYYDFGYRFQTKTKLFHGWITRKDAILIGQYDFKLKRAIPKEGKQ